uniref:Tektin n=1 Tax=Platynereis dumerilii TaxID=6359 RepID=A0AA49K6S9_PLADU|nr:tektin 2 [Platynereis dumerilii]
MATYVKPGERHATSDWFTSNYTISTNAERQRVASDDVRQESRFLRNETDNKTKWDQLDNNTRLSDRVDNIRKWKDILERTLANLDREIADLSQSKDLLEQSLEDKNLPTEVNVENLVTREGRQNIDVVEDEVEDQLKKEQEVINGIKIQLQQKISESFEQICKLQEARQQVLADLQDKNIALGIDVDQYNLTEESSGISYKPDPLRVPKGSTTPQNWEDYSRYNKDRAEAEMQASKNLREAIHQTLQQTDNDLAAQKNATDYAIRKRMHEMKQAIDELKWQKEQTEEEIAELEEEIRRLGDAIRAKINPLKLAQTRLENRTYRPNVELCRDNVQYGLVDEVKQLEASKKALEEKLKQAQHALHGLEEKLHTINKDLQTKMNSLKLDEQAIASRQKLTSKRPQTSMERNMALTGVTREKSKILA